MHEDITEPDEEADEATRREHEIRVQIRQLEAELDALAQGNEEDTNWEEQIAALEAEIAELQAERDQLQEEYSARSEKPVRVDRLLDQFQSDIFEATTLVNRNAHSGELQVEVSAQMFAKEPSRLWKWIGTYYGWPAPARDQCQLRRRVLFTLGTAWLKWLVLLVIWVLAETLYLLFTGVLLIGGVRDINYDVLRHPLENVPLDLLNQSNPSFWFYEKTDEHWSGYKRRPWALCFINPPVFIGGATLGLIAWVFLNQVLFIIIGLSLCFILGLGAYVVESIVSNRSTPDPEAERAKRDAQRAADAAARKIELDHILSSVTCGSVNQPPHTSLPNRRKVRYLAYTAKAKVCRPFAR